MPDTIKKMEKGQESKAAKGFTKYKPTAKISPLKKTKYRQTVTAKHKRKSDCISDSNISGFDPKQRPQIAAAIPTAMKIADKTVSSAKISSPANKSEIGIRNAKTISRIAHAPIKTAPTIFFAKLVAEGFAVSCGGKV